MMIEEAIRRRFTCRTYTGEPVPRADLEAILELAARSPSGSNIQPWQVFVVSGKPLKTLTEKMQAAARQNPDMHRRTFDYYPKRWREPYLTRRRTVGWRLYASLGIGRGDREASRAQALRNHLFFNAPVGIFLTLEEDMEIGSFLDLGMFAQSLMLAALGRGFATSPQVSVAAMHTLIRPALGIPDHPQVIMGIGLGRPDPSAPENHLATDRETPASFATFVGICD